MAWAYDPASRSLLPPHVAVGAGVGAGPEQGSRERQPAAFCTTNFGNFLKVRRRERERRTNEGAIGFLM